jgi:Kinesin motor domain
VERLKEDGVANVAVEGLAATVFAFGQTSSGKTFTMGSYPLASHHDCGIIPRVLKCVLAFLNAFAPRASHHYGDLFPAV